MHDIQLGIRARTGLNKGELEWRRPAADDFADPVEASHIRALLMFTVVVEWTRATQQPGRPRTGRVVTDPDDWLALLPDCLPAYISWEQYQHNLARLKSNQNRASELGAVRPGPRSGLKNEPSPL